MHPHRHTSTAVSEEIPDHFAINSVEVVPMKEMRTKMMRQPTDDIEDGEEFRYVHMFESMAVQRA